MDIPSIEKGSEEEKIMKSMVRMWTNFARCSNPTPPEVESEIMWKPMERNCSNFLDINTILTNGIDPEEDRMVFWRETEKIFKKHNLKLSEA